MNNLAPQGSFRFRNNNSHKDTYSSKDHIQFLDMELHAQNEQFSKIINRKATNLLEDGLLIPAKFLKVEDGHLIVKISKTRAVPRKGEYLTAVLLEGNMPDYRNWNEFSWRDLRVNHQLAISEAICLWQTTSNDPKFNLVGFRGVSIEFANRLIDGCVLILGPKEPPREYLMNLRQIAESKSIYSAFLDFDYINKDWNPTLIDPNRNFPNYVISQLALSPYLIVQGPPGTGKTHKLAELLAVLLKQGNKILVTTMTNRALIELAKKEPLKVALELGLVDKTNLTIDEVKEVPALQNTRNENENGELTLSTFYTSSKEAAKASSPYYDYVIMDEASQALLGMFEATIRLGKKVLWIGDQSQLPPIVQADEKEINHRKALPLIQGMKTICDTFAFPSLMLNQTFRLSNRAAKFTSCFYSQNLIAAKHQPENYFYQNIPKELNFLFNREGGPYWLKIPMPVSEKSPLESISFVSKLVKELHNSDKNLHIAILSKLKKTVTQLQVSINSEIEESEKVLVDTVERVQGMTCDICIFFIPNTSLSMSLNQAFFNVATSRASRHTIIVSDESILNTTTCKGGTRKYLEELDKEFSYDKQSDKTIMESNHNIDPIPTTLENEENENIQVLEIQADVQTNTSNPETADKIGVKVVGMIDLSKFERQKKEIVQDKENLYIIDTNVFINCPDIISKIDKKYPVILSAKVIDELDNLKVKLDEQGKQDVQRALRNINQALNIRDLRMELSDISLLPDDFNKKSPDNMILTVALKYRDQNPIMLTSDNGLQVKAKGLGITTITLKEFLKQPK